MKRSQKIEWLLRILVFGSLTAVGVYEASVIWLTFDDVKSLLLFIFGFSVLFAIAVYVVRRRRLGMLETR